MNKERELLRQALEAWDNEDDVTLIHEVLEEIRTYLSTPSDDAEEPVAWMFPDDIERFQTEETFAQAFSVKCGSPTQGTTLPLYLHPPKPAEPEAEPVGYAVKMIPRGLHFIGFVGEEETEEEIEDYGPDQIVPLYIRPSPSRKPMNADL